MKYLLDEEEYKALVEDKNERRLVCTHKIRDLVCSIAEYVPVDIHGDMWDPEKVTSHQPHGCIHSTLVRTAYCTHDCPAVKLCPLAKSWSK